MKLVYGMLLLGLGCLNVACGNPAATVEDSSQEVEPSTEISLDADKVKVAGIETATARLMSIQEELKVAATVTSNAKGRALVTPPVAGKILQILADAGDTVRQGQVLAIIQSPDLAQASSLVSDAERLQIAAVGDVHRANAELALARSKVRTAQAQLARQNELAKAGAFSQPSLQAAKRDLSQAQAELDTVKQNEAVHQTQLDRAERLFTQELIARTELEMARLVVAQDKVQRKHAEQSVETATAALDREQNISGKGLLNAREVQAAEADVRAAQLEEQRARIELESSQNVVRSAKRAIVNAQRGLEAVRGRGNGGNASTVSLKSPIAGTITERKATLGQAVERASEMFEIENLDTVWVTATVPEKLIASVAKGMPVRVHAAAYPGKTFSGTVHLLDNHLDAKTRTMPVQCLVQNRDGYLREDMFANVMLAIGPAKKALAVPNAALDRHTGEVCVFVASGERYEKRIVKTGRSANGFTEILEGVNAGERVVTKGLFVVESESRQNELQGEED